MKSLLGSGSALTDGDLSLREGPATKQSGSGRLLRFARNGRPLSVESCHHRLLMAFKTTFVWLFVLGISISMLGCGVAGSSGNPPPTSFEVRLVPGKMTQEGSGDLDVIFASAKGTGITGGWLETQQGNKISNSNLVYENLTGRYETMIARNTDGFPAGEYVLKYMESGTTKEFKPGHLSWTTLSRFPPSPVLSWDGLSRILKAQFNSIPGADVQYYLRLYNPDSGYLRKVTPDTTGNQISEFLPETGKIRVMLVGDVFEGGVMKARILHFFIENAY